MENCNTFIELCYFFDSKTDKELLQCLVALNYLKKPSKCSKCRVMMVLRRNSSYKNNHCYQCPKCNRKSGLFEGTFFEQTRLTVQVIMQLLFCWSAHASPSVTTNLTSQRIGTVCQWFRFFRDICSFKLSSIPTIQLGGPGHIVQIDESLVARAKYHRGRNVPERWVFGMLDTSTKKGVILFVDARTREVLIPLIQKHIIPGSEIWSDGWAAYRNLSSLGFVHKVVNHNKEFVAEDGTCTNAIKGYWVQLKKYCRQIDVLKSSMIEEHIDEFLWRQEFCPGPPHRNGRQVFHKLLEHIREKYPM